MRQLWEKSFVAVSVLVLVHSIEAQGRWAKPEDASYATEDEQIEIEIAPDFTYREEQLSRIRILNEEGRRGQGVQRLTYNSRASSLQVLEAWTEIQGKKKRVETQDIQDKPLASARDGFDQLNQIAVAFPDVEPGAVLHLRTVREVKEIPFEGFYSTSFLAGLWSWDKKGHAKITAPFPLYVEEFDLEDFLTVTNRKEGARFTIDVRLKKPVHFKIEDEDEIYIDGTRPPRVTIASSKDWNSLIQTLAPKWESVLSATLPPLYESIVKQAKHESNDVEQLNAVTSRLSQKIRYWADWRPIHGGHVPRSLAVIANTGFGDCKDFSASTIAILRRLGFEALPVFIQRGMKPVLRPGQIPSGNDFNHAIVWAIKNGKTYWIDPTNTVSFAQGTFEDILGRPALVVNGQKKPPEATLLNTPDEVPESSTQEISLITEPLQDGTLRTRGSLILQGRSALRWAGDGLNKSKQSIEYQLITLLASENRLLKWKASAPGLEERIVRDMKFDVDFTERGEDLRTSAGPALFLRYGALITTLMMRTENRESDLWLGSPVHVLRKHTLKKANLIGTQPLSCKIESSWADITREVGAHEKDHTIEIETSIRLKRKFVSRSEYDTQKWKAFQAQVRDCFDRVALVYQPQK